MDRPAFGNECVALFLLNYQHSCGNHQLQQSLNCNESVAPNTAINSQRKLFSQSIKAVTIHKCYENSYIQNCIKVQLSTFWCAVFLHLSECRPYQTAKLVLQQLGGSAQWSLTGQWLKWLDTMGWRVSCRQWISAHADIWNERANPGTCFQRPHTHDYPSDLKGKYTQVSFNSHRLNILTDLLLLYSEQPDCWAPLRSSVPAEDHWPQMAVNERTHRGTTWQWQPESYRRDYTCVWNQSTFIIFEAKHTSSAETSSANPTQKVLLSSTFPTSRI